MFNINHDGFVATFNPTNTQHFNSELNVYLPAENGVPPGGSPGSLLTKVSGADFDTTWVLPEDQLVPDSNLPVTSGAVYTALINAIESIMTTCAPIYYNSQENWDLQPQLISERRAVYVYYNHTYITDGNNVRHPVPAIKVGDGTSYLIDMPFINEDVVIELANHINDNVIHVTAADKEFWNDKVTCYMDTEDNELLIFSKT